MQKKFLPLIIIFGIIFIFLLVILFNNGGNNCPPIKKVNNQNEHSNIDSFRVYIETSMSMKGYVSTLGVTGNYKMKMVVPKLLTELEIDKPTNIFTVSGTIKPYQSPLEDLILELRSGSIFQEGFTDLHVMIESILNSTSENTVSFLISDCIPYLQGNFNIAADKHILQNYIYNALIKTKNSFKDSSLSILILQYYSDFNGKFYYDYNNKQPHNGKELHKRPFYIIAFGSSGNLKELLNRNLFNNYHNIASYGLTYNNVKYSLLSSPVNGYLLVHDEQSVIEIKQKVTEKSPVSFFIGVDLSWISNAESIIPLLEANLKLKPSHIKSQIQVINLEQFRNKSGYQKVAEKIEKLGLNYFINVTLSNVSGGCKKYNLILENRMDSWIDSCNINDDSNLTRDELEEKTFLVKSVTGGFKDAFKKHSYIFEIPFNIKRD